MCEQLFERKSLSLLSQFERTSFPFAILHFPGDVFFERQFSAVHKRCCPAAAGRGPTGSTYPLSIPPFMEMSRSAAAADMTITFRHVVGSCNFVARVIRRRCWLPWQREYFDYGHRAALTRDRSSVSLFVTMAAVCIAVATWVGLSLWSLDTSCAVLVRGCSGASTLAIDVTYMEGYSARTHGGRCFEGSTKLRASRIVASDRGIICGTLYLLTRRNALV